MSVLRDVGYSVARPGNVAYPTVDGNLVIQTKLADSGHILTDNQNTIGNRGRVRKSVWHRLWETPSDDGVIPQVILPEGIRKSLLGYTGQIGVNKISERIRQ